MKSKAQFIISLFSIELKHDFLKSYLPLIGGLMEDLSNGFIEHFKLSVQMMEKPKQVSLHLDEITVNHNFYAVEDLIFIVHAQYYLAVILIW